MRKTIPCIELLGGPSAVARYIGTSRQVVSDWGNKTGKVPRKWQPQLLKLAMETGVTLRPEDFFSAERLDQFPKATVETKALLDDAVAAQKALRTAMAAISRLRDKI